MIVKFNFYYIYVLLAEKRALHARLSTFFSIIFCCVYILCCF